MRLNNEMPEFVVMASKYKKAVENSMESRCVYACPPRRRQVRSSRVHEGMLVGVKQMDKDTGIMPWESLQVEWDDETDTNTVSPWEVEL
ncbi:unnamed protein product, partial [Ascophyllum nodosum]